MDVFVAGGSGFVGRSLCRRLVDRGHGVTAASRSPSPDDLPAEVDTVSIDVRQPIPDEVVAGHDAVVNLVALPSHRPARETTHEAVQVDGTRHLVEAATRAGADRFLLLSALGVDAAIDTAYFRAKRNAEAIVRDAEIDWTIVRPSVVFGEGCAFLPFLRRVVPPFVAPLPDGGDMALQPIWVEDLTPILVDCLEATEHTGATYEIGGPEVRSLAEIIRLVCDDPTVVNLPGPLGKLGFAIADALPFVPLGRDQYRAFHHDNVVEDNDITAFGVDPADLRPLETYLNSHI